MLIEFSVANFRSFEKRQSFSLVKAFGDELEDTNVFKVEAASQFELLRSAAIYGPNAGGKSNYLRALNAMKHVVMNSATSQQRGDTLPVVPFRLRESMLKKPSEFEVIFIADKVRYQYGFTTTRNRIHEEWLIAYPKGRPQRWFDRSWDKSSREYRWDLGSNLLGEKKVWQKTTRANALFLSTAVQLNSEQLQPVFDWFNNTLHLANLQGWGPGFSASMCENNEKSKVLSFLKAADLNIEDILVKREPFDTGSLPDDMPAPVKEMIIKKLKNEQVLDIKTIHRNAEGKSVSFEFEDESDGTQRLFSFAGPWIDSLNHGNVLFIDELHGHLHPTLVKFLVQLFHSDETNKKNAQLVFTTHETSILDQDIFRRDQVWFCEKDNNQATKMYPLTDFSPRKGRENLELAYLSGRYGALPFVKPLMFKNTNIH